MVTITLDRLSQQSLSKDLHFGDLFSFMKFLRENNYITEFGMVDDTLLSDKELHHIDDTMKIDRSSFIDITSA